MINMPSYIKYSYMNWLFLLSTGHSKLNAEKDYSLTGSTASKVFGAFNSVAIIATTYGNNIWQWDYSRDPGLLDSFLIHYLL